VEVVVAEVAEIVVVLLVEAVVVEAG